MKHLVFYQYWAQVASVFPPNKKKKCLKKSCNQKKTLTNWPLAKGYHKIDFPEGKGHLTSGVTNETDNNPLFRRPLLGTLNNDSSFHCSLHDHFGFL